MNLNQLESITERLASNNALCVSELEALKAMRDIVAALRVSRGLSLDADISGVVAAARGEPDGGEKPLLRVLVTLQDGAVEQAHDAGVELVVFDRDNYADDPEGTAIAPANFADLAASLDVPYESIDFDPSAPIF